MATTAAYVAADQRAPLRGPLAQDRDPQPEQPGDDRVGDHQEQERLLVERRLGRQVGAGRRLDEPALDERRDADEGEEGDDDRVAEGRRPVVRPRLALPLGEPLLEAERPVDEDRDGEHGRDEQEVDRDHPDRPEARGGGQPRQDHPLERRLPDPAVAEVRRRPDRDRQRR